MIFNQRKYKEKRILLIDATHEYKSERSQNYLQRQHIEHIVSTYWSLHIAASQLKKDSLS